MDKIQNFEAICRSCLNERPNMKYLFDVIISEEDQVKITDFIDKMTSIKITKYDGLPENICMLCIEEICNAYKFAQKCIISHNRLQLLQVNLVNDLKTAETNNRIALEESDEENNCSDACDMNDDVLDEELVIKCSEVKKNKKHKCVLCCKSFDTKDKFFNHEKEHLSDTYECLECDKTFSKLNHLKVHSKTHKSQKKKHMCDECGQSFNYGYLLKQHSYKHLEKKPYPCPSCTKGCFTAESLRRHMKVHDENYEKKVHACEICFKEFPYPSFLAEHMKNHTGEKPFLCSTCGKGFRQKGALKYHVRIHTGVKPYSCSYCDKHFTSQGVLRVHMRKHTNERPYVCDVCGIAFRQSTDLKSHHRTHTGDKPVLCTICGKRMSTTGQLTVHLRTHTGEKPFPCKMCGKAFATRTMLIKHERIHTGERPYVCNICGKAFNQSGSLKTHSQTHVICKNKIGQEKGNKSDNKLIIDEKNCLILDLNSTLEIDGKSNSVILLPAPVPHV